MTLGKITTDNNVEYIVKSEQTRERDSKPKTLKNKSNPRKQNNNVSQNIKKTNKNVAASGFGVLK